jgi:hypothetical protein
MQDMARRGYLLLAGVVSAIIAAADLTSAFAEDAATAPAQAKEVQVAASSSGAPPANSPPARAETVRAAKPKVVQTNAVARPIVVAARERCWLFCGHQVLLMLGVAY